MKHQVIVSMGYLSAGRGKVFFLGRAILEQEGTFTAMMLTKSFSPSVSRMVEIVCLAIVIRSPFMLPLVSTTITMSLGEVAACMYL